MNPYRRWGKRVFDLGVACAVLVAASPVMLAVAAMIRLEDGGPALFRQARVGRNGAPFTIFKFRSMPVSTPHLPSDMAGTLRPTRIGAIIRRTNVDELPQLLNIVRGDMSIVGPRPALPAQVELIARRETNGALGCTPGLTGLAQINAFDGMSVETKADWDGRYASRVTLLQDLQIILRTFGYLLKPPPVY